MPPLRGRVALAGYAAIVFHQISRCFYKTAFFTGFPASMVLRKFAFITQSSGTLDKKTPSTRSLASELKRLANPRLEPVSRSACTR
jgi:hypothetical protein